MSGNTFGKIFNLTTFGESHGKAIGGVIAGCPANMELDISWIQEELDRRRPGQSSVTTPRNEMDEVQLLSGVFEGKTTGAPIAFIIFNRDHQPGDYDHLKDLFRPSHADFTAFKKYGIRDHRGGGRFSGRETAARVAGGSIAKMVLQKPGISVLAYTSQIGNIEIPGPVDGLVTDDIERSPVRCPNAVISGQMVDLIDHLRKEGDTTGGVVTCIIDNMPAGLGEPVFDKLQADLAKAMLSIGAVKGFEYGSGFAGAFMKGSEHNDIFIQEAGKVRTRTNYSGGIQGGISNGEKIIFKVAFKPVSTLGLSQQTIDKEGRERSFEGKGRHDVCIVPRAVPVVEAMASLVLADHYLRNKSATLD